MKSWCLNDDVKHIKTLPVIVLWFIWKARNQSCFEDINFVPSQVASFSLGLLQSYPQDKIALNIRNVVEESIDKTYAWGYFDGSAARDPKICGAGGKIFISYDHYFYFKAGLGPGTNNFAELVALKLILSLDWDNHIDKI